MINIEELAQCLSVKTDTIITVFFSFLIFTSGVLVRIVYLLIKRYFERKRVRSYFKNIIHCIVEDTTKQIEPFNNIIFSLQMKNHGMIEFAHISANSINLFRKLSFDKVFDAFFSELLVVPTKQRDAFNLLHNKTDLICNIHNKIETDISILESKFQAYEQGWNKEVNNIREFFDRVRQQYFSNGLESVLNDLAFSLNEIMSVWSKQNDRANRTIVKEYIIDKLDSDFFRRHKELSEAINLQNYSINANMFYKNMENVYSLYSGLFTQYRDAYLDYQVEAPLLLKKLRG